MTDEEFQQVISLQHELHGVEFKGPGPRSDGHLLAKVTRAALGMANRRDGGVIVIGVAEFSNRLQPVGLSAADLTTWSYDAVAAGIAPYVDPKIDFELEIHQDRGASYVVLLVKEFDDIPVLCARDHQAELRKGGLYVRTRRQPETTEVPSQTEMRELLDLATEKRVRSFLAAAQRVGLQQGPTSLNDEQRFEEQLGDFP
jgi:predicted HTH transcriptional regulator